MNNEFMSAKDYALTIQDFKNENYQEYNGIYVHPKIIDSLNKPIFRYMQFQHLLMMLKNKKLYVPNRSSFSDITEHGWKENHKYIFPMSVRSRNKKENKECAEYASSKLKNAYNICVSCWTYDVYSSERNAVNENYLMWKSYGFDNISCRIETTIDDLIHSVINKTGVDIIISNVEYVNLHPAAGNIQKYVFEKSPYYQDEKEVRLCVLKCDHHTLLDINPFQMIKEVTLSPFINNLFVQFLIEKFQIDYPELRDKIRKSHVMEH